MNAPDRREVTRALVVLVCIALGLGSRVSVAVVVDASPLERLSRAVAEHPTDPDLAWAYARRLASEGDIGEAVRQTRRFVTRWPDRRPEARVEIARSLLERDATSAAHELLDEELAGDAQSANAHFYRGLVLRSQGELLDADRDFQIAGRLEPGLRPETLLARALGLFEMGREDEAVGLLREILELDPTGDSALRARLLLRQREILDFDGHWRIDAYTGFDWDDNVTLESSAEEVLPSNQADWSGVWGAGASYRQRFSERGALILGARYDQTRYVDLRDYDVLGTTLFASGIWALSPRSVIRLDGIAYNILRDLDEELVGGLIRPNWLFSLGRDWGTLRTFAQFEIDEYDEDAPFEPWERDARSYALGLEHVLPLRVSESWVSLSFSWMRTLTQAEPGGGADGFDGDFDYDSYRLRGLARLALPLEIRAEIDLAYTYDRYHNDNLAHAIVTLGGTRQREDDIMSGRITLGRPLIDHVRIEVYWEGTRRVSNVDLFDYDKQRAGMRLRISTD